MAYIDKIKKGNNIYDIQDKRINDGDIVTTIGGASGDIKVGTGLSMKDNTLSATGGGSGGDFNDLVLFEMLRKAYPYKIPVYNLEMSKSGILFTDEQIKSYLCPSGYDGIVYYLKIAQGSDQNHLLLYFTTVPLNLSREGITAKLLNKDGDILYTLTAETSGTFYTKFASFDIDINSIDLSNVVAANIVICIAPPTR